jgi:hypothetical protein
VARFVLHRLWSGLYGSHGAAFNKITAVKYVMAVSIAYDVLQAGGDVQYGNEGTVNTIVDGNLVLGKHSGVVFPFVKVFLSDLEKPRPGMIGRSALTGELPCR